MRTNVPFMIIHVIYEGNGLFVTISIIYVEHFWYCPVWVWGHGNKTVTPKLKPNMKGNKRAEAIVPFNQCYEGTYIGDIQSRNRHFSEECHRQQNHFKFLSFKHFDLLLILHIFPSVNTADFVLYKILLISNKWLL